MDAYSAYTQYKPLLMKLCRRYAGRGLDFEDLLQEAYIATDRAVKGYDGDKAGFITCLFTICQRHLLRVIEDAGANIRIPNHRHAQIRAYKRFVGWYIQTSGEEPPIRRTAAALGLSERVILEIRAAMQRLHPVSLSEPIDDESGLTVQDTIADEAVGVHEQTEAADCGARLLPIIKATLSPSELEAFATTGRIGYKTAHKLQRNDDIRRTYREYYAFRHVGVSEFNRTWTSSVEHEVLRRDFASKH